MVLDDDVHPGGERPRGREARFECRERQRAEGVVNEGVVKDDAGLRLELRAHPLAERRVETVLVAHFEQRRARAAGHGVEREGAEIIQREGNAAARETRRARRDVDRLQEALTRNARSGERRLRSGSRVQEGGEQHVRLELGALREALACACAAVAHQGCREGVARKPDALELEMPPEDTLGLPKKRGGVPRWPRVGSTGSTVEGSDAALDDRRRVKVSVREVTRHDGELVAHPVPRVNRHVDAIVSERRGRRDRRVPARVEASADDPIEFATARALVVSDEPKSGAQTTKLRRRVPHGL